MQYPDISLAVHVTDRMVDLVAEGFDLAVRDHVADLVDSDLIARRLGREPDYVVAAPSWGPQHGLPSKPEELEGLAWLSCLGHGRRERWNLTDGSGAVVTVSSPTRFGSDDPSSVVAMTLAGLGPARLPRCICAPLLADGRLIRLLPAWQVEGPTTSLVYPDRRGQLPSVRVVLEFLAATLAQHLDEI